MGVFTVPEAKARLVIAALEAALSEGFPPPGVGAPNTIKGAIRETASRLELDTDTVSRWVGKPNERGLFEKRLNLKPDWSKYKPRPVVPKEPEGVVVMQLGRSSEPTPERDPVEATREQNLIRKLSKENNDLTQALIEAQDIRAGVLGLLDPPLIPTINIPKEIPTKGQRTVIIHLSDWHAGESVNIDEMGGVNSYSIDIFKKRAGRLAESSHALMTDHWKGDPPEKIILIFGGDMITGEIHEELAITNDALSVPSVRTCAEALAGVVKHLRQVAPIDVYSLPGNHGRLTKKPQSKGMAVNSFDTLISQMVEMMCQSIPDIRFFYPKSGDALFSVYKLMFCAVHGDRIGSRGGQGFVGPVATILRGVHKMRAYYTSQGIIVHFFLVAHFHTTAKLPRAFSNGSLIGPSEYSRDLRADPEPAKQNFIVVHSERGVISHEEIYCGTQAEGAIYGPAQ